VQVGALARTYRERTLSGSKRLVPESEDEEDPIDLGLEDQENVRVLASPKLRRNEAGKAVVTPFLGDARPFGAARVKAAGALSAAAATLGTPPRRTGGMPIASAPPDLLPSNSKGLGRSASFVPAAPHGVESYITPRFLSRASTYSARPPGPLLSAEMVAATAEAEAAGVPTWLSRGAFTPCRLWPVETDHTHAEAFEAAVREGEVDAGGGGRRSPGGDEGAGSAPPLSPLPLSPLPLPVPPPPAPLIAVAPPPQAAPAPVPVPAHRMNGDRAGLWDPMSSKEAVMKNGARRGVPNRDSFYEDILLPLCRNATNDPDIAIFDSPYVPHGKLLYSALAAFDNSGQRRLPAPAQEVWAAARFAADEKLQEVEIDGRSIRKDFNTVPKIAVFIRMLRTMRDGEPYTAEMEKLRHQLTYCTRGQLPAVDAAVDVAALFNAARAPGWQHL
jgi:hypothetical protein